MDKNELRSALLTRKQNFISKTLEFDGKDKEGNACVVKVEVRTPSVRARQLIIKAGQAKVSDKGLGGDIDFTAMKLEAVLQCCYSPSDDSKLFERANSDELLGMPAGGMFDQLADTALQLMNGAQEELPKS